MLRLGILLWCSAVSSFGCTAFMLAREGEHTLFAKSYDWNIEDGMILTNKANVNKTALALVPVLRANWRSKYGSLTFNQHGRELPVSGVNNQGLAVEVLWLDSAKHAPPDGRPTVNELQWVQWALDQFSTVDALIQAVDTVQIVPVHAAVHYLACDAGGTCATIEFLSDEPGSKAVIHSGNTLPYPVLANLTYEDSLKKVTEGEFQGLGGKNGIPVDFSSATRFARIAAALIQKPIPSIETANGLLKDVYVEAAPGRKTQTEWNIIYDLTEKQVTYSTRSIRADRTIELKHFEFDCRKDPEVKMLSMQKLPGLLVAQEFVPYTTAANRQLMKTSFAGLPIPPLAMEAGARYPDVQTVCD